MPINPRHQKLLEELPKHNYKVRPAAIKAGYSQSYADGFPKRILKTAMKAQAQALLETANDNPPIKEAKRELAASIGITREELQNTLKKIALNDKDYSSALKILSALAKHDLELNLTTEEAPKTIVPVLNIGVRSIDNGLVEPPNDPPA